MESNLRRLPLITEKPDALYKRLCYMQLTQMTRCAMLIRVMYSDGRFDMVKPNVLDNLLDQQIVTSFKRTNGWAVVGRDAIRSSSRSSYRGTGKASLVRRSNRATWRSTLFSAGKPVRAAFSRELACSGSLPVHVFLPSESAHASSSLYPSVNHREIKCRTQWRAIRLELFHERDIKSQLVTIPFNLL